MFKNLAQEAVSEALSGNWKNAVRINKKIIDLEPSNVDALNRLARAYAELGDLRQARQIAQKVLKNDPFNSIALKALDKWKGLKKAENFSTYQLHPEIFLEEPGKTKIVTLIHPGDPKLLSQLDSGDEVKLNTFSHRVCITTADGKYIGKLPDDLSARLKKLVKFGNEYKVFIKSTDKNEAKVFIREVARSPKLSDLTSFPTEKIEYISFTPPELVHNKEEIHFSHEDEEE